MTLSEITSETEKLIQRVLNGSATQYFSFENEVTGEDWTIRVSNHNANNRRVDNNTISFVINMSDESEDDAYSSLKTNKKQFTTIANQFFLNEKGEFEETFSSINECLEFIIF